MCGGWGCWVAWACGSLPPELTLTWFLIPPQLWDYAWGLLSHSLGSRIGDKGQLNKYWAHLEGWKSSGLLPWDQRWTPSPWSSLGLDQLGRLSMRMDLLQKQALSKGVLRSIPRRQ